MNSSVWRLPFISASTLPVARQRDACGCRGVAVLRRHEFIAGEIELGRLRRGADFALRPDQDGNDELCLGGLDRADQRNRVDGVDDGRADRLSPRAFSMRAWW